MGKRFYNSSISAYIMFIVSICVAWALWILIANGSDGLFGLEFLLLIALFLGSMAFSMLWCEMEDMGNALSVRFGPLSHCCFCGNGSALIPYQSIKAYRPAQGCCEAHCSYGIARVNI